MIDQVSVPVVRTVFLEWASSGTVLDQKLRLNGDGGAEQTDSSLHRLPETTLAGGA
jgi:hypothetical protein